MKPVIDHIQITVRDLRAAEAFYDKLMPILGFDLGKKMKGTDFTPHVTVHRFQSRFEGRSGPVIFTHQGSGGDYRGGTKVLSAAWRGILRHIL